MNAELLMFLGGCAAFGLTLFWVRTRELGVKYALAWLLVGALLLVCGLFPGIIMLAADASRLSYPAAVLFVALGAMFLFSFTVSVSLTRLHRRSVRLVQEVALLQRRLAELERADNVTARDGDSPCDSPGQDQPAGVR
jgi:hypothetical protein